MKRTTNPFKWRHYEPEIILLCVRWYCRYQLSFRDLEAMMHERGLSVHYSTIFRWVQRYAPEINKRGLILSWLVLPIALMRHTSK